MSRAALMAAGTVLAGGLSCRSVYGGPPVPDPPAIDDGAKAGAPQVIYGGPPVPSGNWSPPKPLGSAASEATEMPRPVYGGPPPPWLESSAAHPAKRPHPGPAPRPKTLK